MQSKPKHILFLTSWYPDRILIDNGDFIQRHAQAVALKNKVTVVHAIKDVTLRNKKFQIEINENQDVKEILVYVKSASFGPFNLIYLLQAYLEGLKHVESFDLIHLNVVYPAGLIAKYLNQKLKKPLVLTEHWTSLHADNFKQLPAYKQFFIRNILKSVDLVLPVSAHLGRSILAIQPSIRYRVIPNVVDLDKFSVKTTAKKEVISFLHLSNLDDQHKNIIGLLNVAKSLVSKNYQFQFHIGGNGDLKPIQSFVNTHQLEDYIFPFGRLAHDEVNAKMHDSDCFVLFSRYENQPCVQAEALASGIPVIATNVGGIGEFLPENFGILIDSENEKQLEEAMIEVINGKPFESAESLHHYAKKQFSKEHIAEEFDQFYSKLLTTNSK